MRQRSASRRTGFFPSMAFDSVVFKNLVVGCDRFVFIYTNNIKYLQKFQPLSHPGGNLQMNGGGGLCSKFELFAIFTLNFTDTLKIVQYKII